MARLPMPAKPDPAISTAIIAGSSGVCSGSGHGCPVARTGS